MTATLAPGTAAPDFELPDQHEQTARLTDFAGKWLVLYFYPKDDTPGCTVEARDFSCAADGFSALGAVVVGVSPDPPSRHQRFIAKHELCIRLLSDPEHRVLLAYGAWGEKKRYGRVYDGVIRSTLLIDPAGTIVRVWSNVRVKGHVDEVLSELTARAGTGH